jgi:hypothetical protein|tara:strand:+ start:5930 stop:6220 length:291 start_codon:yes stop_codon:yes gene_type:complete
MISFETGVQVHSVSVMTSDGGGHSTEQIVELAMDKIMSVSNTAPPAIRDQAEAFQNHLRDVLYHYMELARREERANIANKMSQAGNSEMAELVRRI